MATVVAESLAPEGSTSTTNRGRLVRRILRGLGGGLLAGLALSAVLLVGPPLPDGVPGAPETAAAWGCGNNTGPNMVGFLSDSNGNKATGWYKNYPVLNWYGRFTNIVSTYWTSCTNTLEYDGVVVRTLGTTHWWWGLLSNLNLSSCHWVAGTPDWIHANNGACPSPTTNRYAMPMPAENWYQTGAVGVPNDGDMEFVHTICGTNYTGALYGWGVSKPGTNCIAATADVFGTSQGWGWDFTWPQIDSGSASNAGAGSGRTVPITFSVSDPISGVSQTSAHYWNGSDFVPCNSTSGATSGTLYCTFPSDGSVIVGIASQDVAGNYSGVNWLQGVGVDVTGPPTPGITSPTSTFYTSATSGSVTWSAVTDNYSGTAGYQVNYHWATLSNGACINQGADSGWQWVGNTTSWAPTWGSNTCFQFQVRAKDNYGNYGSSSAWSAWVASDQTFPIATFIVPAAGTAFQSTTTLAPAWSEAESGSGVLNRSLQRQAATASDGVCSGPWSDDGTEYTGTSPAPAQTLMSGNCYRWRQTLRDRANNALTVTSGVVLVDATAPAPPAVTDSGASGSYRTGDTIYFRPDAASTIQLTSAGTDAQSGIASSTFGPLSSGTGWTYLPATVPGNPSVRSLTWSSAAGSTLLDVTTTNRAGMQSSATPITFTADSVDPTIGDLLPGTGTASQTATSILVSWTEAEDGSGVASRSLQRQSASAATSSECASATYANDGLAQAATSPVTEADLEVGSCYRWQLTVTDRVGNGTPVVSGMVFIELPTPPEAPSQPDLLASSDSGASAVDNLTNVSSPTLSGTAEPGSEVTIWDGALAVGMATATDGSWTITSTPFSDGNHLITATATNDYGTSAASSAVQITIDTTAPSVPSKPDLDPASDRGLSDADDVTSDTTPSFVGFGESGSTIEIHDGTSSVGSATSMSGSWSVTTVDLSHGVHAISAIATDFAGNASTSSLSLDVTIDGAAPSVFFAFPTEPGPLTSGADVIDVAWTSQDEDSTVWTTLLAREAVPSAGGECPVGGWLNDLPASAATSPTRSAALQPGTCYRWLLTVTDGAGNVTTALSGVVRLGQVVLGSPAPGDAVFDVETLEAHVNPSSSVSRIEFVVDGQTIGSDSTTPYSFDWSTISEVDGAHDVQARLVAVDESTELAPSVPIAVNNELPSDDRIRLDRDRGRIGADERALYAVYAWGANEMLPDRYRSDSPSSIETPFEITAAEFASLSPATQTEITDFLSQDLRGTAFAPPVGVQVGRSDAAFSECTHTGGRGGTTIYCKHSTLDGHFQIIYYLSSPSHQDGVPEVDIMNGDLEGTPANPLPNQVPDVVDQAGWSLQDARAKYELWGYRDLPDLQRVWFRPPPCGFDGCATNYPFAGLEISFASDTSRPIYLARHELFHLVQFLYASSFSTELPGGFVVRDNNTFWTEATAEWAARKVDAASTQKDADHEYVAFIGNYLSRPTLPFELWETGAEGGRQYGMFMVAAYLSERFGEDFLRQIWERRAEARDVDQAIDELVAPMGLQFKDVLDGFARNAYLMDFADEDRADVWVPRLNGGTTAEDDLGLARPERDRHDLALGVEVPGTISIEPGGFKILEFVPPPGVAGTLHLEVSDDDRWAPPEVHVRVLEFDSYPAVCQEYVLEDGAQNMTNWTGTVDISLGPIGCSWAAVVLTNSDTLYFDNTTRTINYSATFFQGTAFDTFDRLDSGGWGRGGLGDWLTLDPSYDQYLSVDGESGIVNQVAPLAAGDITLGVQHAMSDPVLNPVDITFTFRQSTPANPADPFIDNVFYLAGDLGLTQPWIGVEVWACPSNQYQTWCVDIGDDRPLETYQAGTFTPSPYGDPVRLRLKVDASGTYAKLWMASEVEPQAWTASYTRSTPLSSGWSPDWLVLQPRQTNDAGTQTFALDEVVITSGSLAQP